MAEVYKEVVRDEPIHDGTHRSLIELECGHTREAQARETWNRVGMQMRCPKCSGDAWDGEGPEPW